MRADIGAVSYREPFPIMGRDVPHEVWATSGAVGGFLRRRFPGCPSGAGGRRAAGKGDLA